MNHSIQRFVHGGMLVLPESTSAREAARAMHERGMGCVVLAGTTGGIKGLVTDRDLATQVLAFGYSPDTSIGEFASLDFYSIDKESSLGEVIEIMEQYGVRRVPIVERYGSGRERCVGIVTLDDLILDQAISLESLSAIIAKQISRPMRRARGNGHRQNRLEHTLNRFYSNIASHTGLDRDLAEEVSFYILSEIVQRLPYNGAAQFISQLPRLLQEDLLDLHAGPDREISAASIVRGLVVRFSLPMSRARKIVSEFWEALEDFTRKSGETDHVLGQLPEDMRRLLHHGTETVPPV